VFALYFTTNWLPLLGALREGKKMPKNDAAAALTAG